MDPVTIVFLIAAVGLSAGALAVRNAAIKSLFTKYGGVIPAAYLNVLAKKESGHDPRIVNPKSHATGLFQITPPALNAYNQRNGTKVVFAQLFDPDLNTRVAADHLKAVVRSYKRIKSLTTNWSDPRWVALLTLGWNAGDGAVTTLAQQLEAQGVPVTVDTVSRAAVSGGKLTRFAADQGRVAWAKQVADLYARMVPRYAAT